MKRLQWPRSTNLAYVVACALATVGGFLFVAGGRMLFAGRIAQGEPMRLPDGVDRIAIVIGSSWCPACRNDSLPAAIAALHHQLRERARAEGRSFSTMGVAIDWNSDRGLEWLARVGQFDEITVGRSWANSAAIRHIWREAQATPALPQVVLIERTVRPDSNRLRIGEDRLLDRRYGLTEIVDWERALRGIDARAAPNEKRSRP